MESNVVKWVQYDNKMKEYAEKIKVLRKERDGLSSSILDKLEVPENAKNRDLPQFTIDALNTKISCHKSKQYESLNYKFLTECLRDYFQMKWESNDSGESSDSVTQSEEAAKDILVYIRKRRGYEEKLILKRETLASDKED